MISRHPDMAQAYEEVSHREHIQLLDAVVARDLPSAERILQAHIWAARDLLVSHARAQERAGGGPLHAAAND